MRSGREFRAGDEHPQRAIERLPRAAGRNRRFAAATGRYLFGQLCLAAQLQRDLDSERMTGMQRRLFEDGRHRGHDPLGYRSLRDAAGDWSIPVSWR